MNALHKLVAAEVVLLAGLAVYSTWPRPRPAVRAYELSPSEWAEAQAGADRIYGRMLARWPRARPRIRRAARKARIRRQDPRERRIEDAAWGGPDDEAAPRPTVNTKPVPRPLTTEEEILYWKWVRSQMRRPAARQPVYRIVQGRPRPVLMYSEGPTGQPGITPQQRQFQQDFYEQANRRFYGPGTNVRSFMPPPPVGLRRH